MGYNAVHQEQLYVLQAKFENQNLNIKKNPSADFVYIG